VKREDEKQHEATWRRLVATARAIDPDPWRDALRKEIGQNNSTVALCLASDEKSLLSNRPGVCSYLNKPSPPRVTQRLGSAFYCAPGSLLQTTSEFAQRLRHFGANVLSDSQLQRWHFGLRVRERTTCSRKLFYRKARC
jgi:hypothetical protein